MSLKECAPWLFGRVFSSSKGREISSSEALAVQRLFSSLLSKAEAEAEKEAKSQEVWHSWSSPTAVHCHACMQKGDVRLRQSSRRPSRLIPRPQRRRAITDVCRFTDYVALNMGAAGGGLEAIQLLLTDRMIPTGRSGEK
jgi:hypothetical protein